MPRKHFHDQFENEVSYGFFRKHWIVLMPVFARTIFSLTVIFLAVSLILSLFKTYNFAANILDYVLLTIFVITVIEIHVFFMRIISWLLSVVILTDFRLMDIAKTVFTQDEKESVDLKKIQDIQVHKIGFIRNLLNFGRINLTLSNINDSKELRQVPNVSEWASRINQVRLSAIGSKKVHKSGIENEELERLVEETEEEINTFLGL